jgi:hypothetical protein
MSIKKDTGKKKPLRCMAEGLKWLEEIVWGICLIEPVVIPKTFDKVTT